MVKIQMYNKQEMSENEKYDNLNYKSC